MVPPAVDQTQSQCRRSDRGDAEPDDVDGAVPGYALQSQMRLTPTQRTPRPTAMRQTLEGTTQATAPHAVSTAHWGVPATAAHRLVPPLSIHTVCQKAPCVEC